MKTRSHFSFVSFIRTLTVATLGLAGLTTCPTAQAASGSGKGVVSYNIPLQIAQGVVPFNYGYTLMIVSPSTILATPLTPVTVTLIPSVVSAPSGVSNAQALSYLLLSSTTITVTSPLQSIAVQVSLNIPAGNAGAYNYEIQTSGWSPSLGIADPGAFINVTAAAPQIAPQLPVIQITQPVDQTNYVWDPSSGPLVIPYTIVGSTTDGSNLTGMTASVNGSDLGISPSGIGSANATATGNFSVSAPGTYVISAADSNINGVASATATIAVTVMGDPPTVVISTPAPNTTFTLTGNEVDVPFTFTGTSTYSGISQLTATLDGTPITITPNGLGDLVAAGNGTLPFTSAGDHELVVTASNDYGTATTSEILTVVAQAPLIPPTVVINTPTDGSTFSVVQGSTLAVPFTFVGSTTGDPITNLTATLDGNTVAFATTGLNTQSATGTTNLSFNTTGNHVLAVTATNDGGVASAISHFSINVQPANLTVAINKPAPNSTYAIPTVGGSVSIPDAFTAKSTAPSGVTSLSVTLNGNSSAVTTSSLNQPTVTANGTLVISQAGTYTIAVTATDQNGAATTQENITVTAPGGSQNPCLNVVITKPRNGATFNLGTPNCPLYVPVNLTANTSSGTTLSTLTLTLNGKAVTLTTLKGIGTVSANGTVNLPITFAGNYTLVATTTSGSSSASATTTFTVNANNGNNGGYNQGGSYSGWDGGSFSWGWGGFGSGGCYNVTQYTSSPPPCNVNWQQSWSCGTTQKSGSTLPICFQVQYTGANCASNWSGYFSKYGDDYYGCDKSARSSWGSSGYTNCLLGNVLRDRDCLNNNWDSKGGKEVSCDTTVQVCVYEVYANGKCGTPTTYNCNSGWNWYSNSGSTCSINSNDQYACNFKCSTGTHTYRCDVYYTDQNSGKQCFLGSQQFSCK